MTTLIKQRRDQWLQSTGVLSVFGVYLSDKGDCDHMARAASQLLPYLKTGIGVTVWNSGDCEYLVVHKPGAIFTSSEMEMADNLDLPEAIILGLIKRDEVPPQLLNDDIEGRLIELLDEHRTDITNPNWAPPDRTNL